MAFEKSSVFLILVLFAAVLPSRASTLDVGGKDGWTLDSRESYGHWAGRLRFQVNDTLRFKYNKDTDSVLVVNKDDYNNCNTNNPILKLDDGDSLFKFDRSGPFYFITGNKSHCDHGQKLIVVVLAIRHSTPSTPTPSLTPSPAPAPHAPASEPSPAPTTHAPASEPSHAPSPNAPASEPSPAPSVEPPVPETETPPSPTPSPHAPASEVSPAPPVEPAVPEIKTPPPSPSLPGNESSTAGATLVAWSAMSIVIMSLIMTSFLY